MVNITVITSIYNSHVFLEGYFKAVGEIENAGEIEILLIHNEPNEKELAIIQLYLPGFPFIRHIIVPRREGLYASWNRAINMAAGKYLAVWNTDDIRLPGSLVAQRTALDKNPAASICYGDFYGTDDYGCFNKRLYRYDEYGALKKAALRRHIIGCFPMWRREIHGQTGFFDEQFRLVGDFEFQVRVALQHDLIKAATILGYYLENKSHKLSSNRRLQDRERTVVELRYRMYDKVMLHVLPFISGFRIRQVLYAGRWIWLNELVPPCSQPRVKSFFSLVAAPFTYSFWAIKRTFNKLFRVITN